MRAWLSRHLWQPFQASGPEYARAVQKHWPPLVAGILALVGASQVVFPSLDLPYWLWLVVGFGLLSWAQLLAFHDIRAERNEKADELRIGHEARRSLEATAIALRERVPQRDLIVQWAHELRLMETFYHRTNANPVHPLTVHHVRTELEAMDARVRIYLATLDADTAERFLAIPIAVKDPVRTGTVSRKLLVLEEFIHDPRFFPPDGHR